ncbi:MAG: substrate-binding domain-containing protein [Fimbriiglobus sp.]|nr:substrate-binding domain-containing protein [Fimbriiglobus sp.]
MAARIEAELTAGAWDGGKMPSVRGIATQYGVSVVTASRALQVLRDKGLIQTIERSGCYRIPPPTADRWAVCLRLTPGAAQRETFSIAQAGFLTVARRLPMHLSFDAFEVTSALTTEEARAAARKAAADGVKGVFLLPSRVSTAEAAADVAFVEGCQQAGLRVVLIERGIRGQIAHAHDLVAIDDVAAARECVEHLYATGRRRVGLVVASPTTSHNDRIAGYLHAVHDAQFSDFVRKPPPTPVVIRQPTDLPTREAYASVADEVVRHKLDGVVCYQDYSAVGVIVELLQRRIRVPKDIGVVGFDNLPIAAEFSIPLTTFDYPGEAMADIALRLMKHRLENPTRPPVKVVVPSTLIIRASTAPT